ncbi:MAG TPA: ABC transporter substrate-binding protein [Stellaceae bacterium]|nr:ABC transporter substrate-binding protein [Stellaceae bacterium]
MTAEIIIDNVIHRWAALAFAVLASCAVTAPAVAQQSPAVRIGYLALAVKRSWPLSYLDQPPADEGIQGARLGLADDRTTGHFTNQDFELDEQIQPDEAAVTDAFGKLVAAGARLVVTDLPAPLLVKLADSPPAKDAILLDATQTDDSLRGENCRRNVLHLLPSRAMLADALMQYLAVKNWRHIMLAVGQGEDDKEYAEAVRRSAKKFQISIAEDKPWTFVAGARRTDTGHFQIEAEVARFTQGIGYDVLVVADEADNFGDELAYRTTDPRPVAGTQGLVATAWARPFEQWGATQLQNRFLREAKRWMTDRDFGAWMAVRAVGEAATRAGSADPEAIIAYLTGDKFEMSAFKGVSLSFRPWDGQLRQPVLLADAHSLVSVSPQPGFLHQYFETDTLGIDQPETTCKFK